jgi:hypothetical protein
MGGGEERERIICRNAYIEVSLSGGRRLSGKQLDQEKHTLQSRDHIENNDADATPDLPLSSRLLRRRDGLLDVEPGPVNLGSLCERRRAPVSAFHRKKTKARDRRTSVLLLEPDVRRFEMIVAEEPSSRAKRTRVLQEEKKGELEIKEGRSRERTNGTGENEMLRLRSRSSRQRSVPIDAPSNAPYPA